MSGLAVSHLLGDFSQPPPPARPTAASPAQSSQPTAGPVPSQMNSGMAAPAAPPAQLPSPTADIQPPAAPQQSGDGGAPAPVTPAAGQDQAVQTSRVNQLDAMIVPREGAQPWSVGAGGEIGVGQVKPETAVPYLFGRDADPRDPKVLAAAKQALMDPKINEMVRKTHLAALDRRYGGDTDAVLAAYNAGPAVVDKWVASGKSPGILPDSTMHYIGEPLSAQWGHFTPQEQAMMDHRTTLTDDAAHKLGGLQLDYAREAAQAPPGSAKRDALIEKYSDSLQQMQQEWRQKVASPPIEKPVDAFANFGSVASIVGLLGGLLTRQHVTGALNAAASAMTAINENNHEQFTQAYATWKTQAELAGQMISMENQDLRTLLEDKRMAVDEKNSRLATLNAQMGQTVTSANLQTGNIDAGWKMLEIKEQAAQAWQSHTDQIQMHYDAMHLAAASKAMNPQVAAYQKFTEEHPNATAEEIQAFLQRGHAARSGPAAAVQKFLQENPDATAEDVSKFVAHVRAQGAAEQAFETGPQGNTVRSFNVAMNHMDTLVALGEALENGDVQRINSMKNRIKAEFGYEGPVDFNFAKQIVGDEIVKAVLGTQAGSLEDRRTLKEAFDVANSPAQLLGVLRVGDSLIAGQLTELKRQYEGAGLENFDEKLSPKAKERIGAPPIGQGTYSSANDVVSAYRSGTLSRDQAADILRQHGWAQ